MWNTVLGINSVLWVIAATFLVYATGASILLWTARPFEVALILAALLTCSEVVFGLIAD